MENLLELPWEEISEWYPKGMIPWLKRNHPDQWDELLSIEKDLNRASMARDECATAELLVKYRDFVKEMAQEF